MNLLEISDKTIIRIIPYKTLLSPEHDKTHAGEEAHAPADIAGLGFRGLVRV